MQPETGGGAFPPTLWSQIVRAQDGAEATRRDALDRLLGAYWRPVYAGIRYGWNKSPEDARDLTQDFLASLLERKFWEQIDPSRGRFRSFLKAALKHFMMNQARDQSRQKRAHTAISVEAFDVPDYAGKPPEDVLDQEWISTVLQRAVDRLQAEFSKEGKAAYFEVLKRYDLEGGATYGEIAKALGISESDVRNYLHAARARLKTLVRDAVHEYSADAADLQEELRFILG
jgi:RNA polymerase sigma-70 factor (ECF subfamily)